MDTAFPKGRKFPHQLSARSASVTSRNVIDDIAIEVGHDHDVELVRIGDELHAAIVDDHGFELDVGIVSGDVFAALEKLPVSQFHDVGFVHGRHFFAPIPHGVVEGEFSDPLALSSETTSLNT